VVSHTEKPAKNHKKNAWCRKNRMHFGGDSDVFSDGQSHALIAMGRLVRGFLA